MASIYKNNQVKEQLMELYDKKMQSLELNYTNIDVNTKFGNTRVVKCGNNEAPTLVLFHGFNAGAPITLEPIKELTQDFCFYVIESLGQTTKSDETILDIKNDDFAVWAKEVFEALSISSSDVVGISYGAFIVQKIMVHQPQLLKKSVLVVPSGIVKGKVGPSLKQLTWPLIRWKITKKESHLKAFLKAFAPIADEHIYKFLSIIMKGVKLDTRIPKLLQEKDCDHFDGEVYVIGAKKDIYFPGEQVIMRCKQLFKNFKEAHLLENSRHMPSKLEYQEIQDKLVLWLKE